MEHEDAVRTHAAERYLLEEMADDERDAFEAHFFECGECAESVRVGAALADAARAGAAGATRPAAAPLVFRPRRSALQTFVPMAAAAMFALVAGYQAFVTIPELRSRVEAPQAVVPIALAPTSRGTGADVPVDRAGTSWVALSLDINAAPPLATQLDYDLRTDAGVLVLSGRVPVPPQGESPILLVPGNLLMAGQYAIVVRDGTDPNQEVGTYRFAVR